MRLDRIHGFRLGAQQILVITATTSYNLTSLASLDLVYPPAYRHIVRYKFCALQVLHIIFHGTLEFRKEVRNPASTTLALKQHPTYHSSAYPAPRSQHNMRTQDSSQQHRRHLHS